MTNNNHPITPPAELVKEWMAEIWHEGAPVRVAASDLHIATQAANWGADRQLEQCVDWVNEYESAWLNGYEREGPVAEQMRNACRPKPPSLKEQALEALNEAVYMAEDSPPEGITTDQSDIIRRALEFLPD